MSSYLPSAQPYIISSKDLFDYEGCVMSTLMENNMTNKPMGLKLL